VNRLWGYLAGVGLIEPIDDIRAGNPPTNPKLLQAMTKDFIDSGFDVQHMLRAICKSRTYQLSVATNEWNKDDTINYSHALPRRLPAEVLYDAIHTATGSPTRIAGVPVGFRAAELPDVGVKVPFLDDFGRPVRESACECERATGVVLGPIMKLINGPTVSDALSDGDNALSKLVASDLDDAKIVEELFLRFLSREPTQKETEICLQTIQGAANDRTVVEQEIAAVNRQIAVGIAKWESTLAEEPTWTSIEPTDVTSDAGANFATTKEGIVAVDGKLEKDTYHVSLSPTQKQITGIRLEVLADDKLPSKGPGRADNGNFVLNELTAEIVSGTQASKISLQNATADFSQSGWGVGGAIDGNPNSGWAISPQSGKNHVATFETKQEHAVPEGAMLRLSMSQQHDGKHNIGRFRILLTDSKRPLAPETLPSNIKNVLAVVADDRSAEQSVLLRNHYLMVEQPRLKETLRRLEMRLQQSKNPRLTGVQDVSWALINNPAFLFNR